MDEIINYVMISKRRLFQLGFGAMYLYAGQEEIAKIKESGELVLNANHYDENTKKIGGRFFCDLKIVEVNEDSHLNVC